MKKEKIKGFEKIPIIFIFNRNSGNLDKNMFIKFLTKDNKFSSLYNDKIIENQNITKKRFSKKNEIKDNIIEVNLKSNHSSNIFGVELLLETSYQILINNNKFEKKDFEDLKEINDKRKLNDYKELSKKIEEICKKYTLLRKCNNVNKIIKVGREKSEKNLRYYAFQGFAAGLTSPLYFVDMPILYFIYNNMINQIGKNFGRENTFTNTEIVKLILGLKDSKNLIRPGLEKSGNILENQIEQGINIYRKKVWDANGGYIQKGANYIFDNELYEQKLIDKKYLFKLFDREDLLYKIMGTIPYLTALIGGFLDYRHTYDVAEMAIQHFEEEIRKEQGVSYIIGIQEKLSLIFDFIKKMSKENWNEIKINEIGNFEN